MLDLMKKKNILPHWSIFCLFSGHIFLESKLFRMIFGIEGEVFISGACLSPGYLDDTDATSNAFVTDEKGRSLRSFDLGRWEMSKMTEKTLVILGRSNHMVTGVFLVHISLLV